uniref:C2H2-type domain-containing protein n=1 Tax=Parastrongyloides trichosuri TaxID=131310 RepID=A0A0N4ZHX1_PARTI
MPPKKSHNLIKRGSKKKYFCTICNKTIIKLVREDHFFMHKKKDSEPARYVCSYNNCGFNSHWTTILEEHFRKNHDEVQFDQCIRYIIDTKAHLVSEYISEINEKIKPLSSKNIGMKK